MRTVCQRLFGALAPFDEAHPWPVLFGAGAVWTGRATARSAQGNTRQPPLPAEPAQAVAKTA